MAVIGKRVIHPGGRRSTRELFKRAHFQPGQQVLDVGCGVGTSAIHIVKHYGVNVTAVDISTLMLERCQSNVQAAALDGRIAVESGDITALQFPNDCFDRVLAEAVTMFVDRRHATRELVRVCRPGGRVLATEFLWAKPPTDQARQIFLGEVCPGMTFDSLADWLDLYRQAGLENIQVTTGPFDMMTLRGFSSDEGLANSVAIMIRVALRPDYAKKMLWMWPRVNRAVPYLGYVAISGDKPV
jgi:cyclopropane fatty-acyl-phospholipid synthase-like methyltransferase